MGYTHYVRQQRDFTHEEWKMIKSSFNKIWELSKVSLAGACGEENTKPAVTDNKIWFNGVEDDSHEAFGIDREKKSDFEFCKTACKPYDLVVTGLLYFIKTKIPDVIEVSSDGSIDGEDWEEGRLLASKVL